MTKRSALAPLEPTKTTAVPRANAVSLSTQLDELLGPGALQATEFLCEVVRGTIKVPPNVRVSAAQDILNRRHGRPVDVQAQIQVTANATGNIEIGSEALDVLLSALTGLPLPASTSAHTALPAETRAGINAGILERVEPPKPMKRRGRPKRGSLTAGHIAPPPPPAPLPAVPELDASDVANPSDLFEALTTPLGPGLGAPPEGGAGDPE